MEDKGREHFIREAGAMAEADHPTQRLAGKLLRDHFPKIVDELLDHFSKHGIGEPALNAIAHFNMMVAEAACDIKGANDKPIEAKLREAFVLYSSEACRVFIDRIDQKEFEQRYMPDHIKLLFDVAADAEIAHAKRGRVDVH